MPDDPGDRVYASGAPGDVHALGDMGPLSVCGMSASTPGDGAALQDGRCEVLDSEDDDSDPFIEYRRARTYPLQNCEKRCEVRPHTAPGPQRKLKKRSRADAVKDDDDASNVSMDVTEMSTQMTGETTIVGEFDAVISLPITTTNMGDATEMNRAAGGNSEEGSRVGTQNTFTGAEQSFLAHLPCKPVEHVNDFEVSLYVKSAEEAIVGTRSSSPPGDVKQTTAIEETAVLQGINLIPVSLPAILEFPDTPGESDGAARTPVQKDPELMKDDKTEPLQKHPTKRKATLSELCARKTSVPYRVGLSNRANVQRLHPYLSVNHDKNK